MVHISIVFANLILQQQRFEFMASLFHSWLFSLLFEHFQHCFEILCLCPYYYYAGPSRRTPHLSGRSSHPVRQPAHRSCYLQHHSWRGAAPHHRHHSPTGLQAEVTWERPHSEAPADADGQSGVPSGSGVQGGWVRLIWDLFIKLTLPKECLICSCLTAPSIENWCFDWC